MNHSAVPKALLAKAMQWFQPHFRQTLVNPIESHFPNYPFTDEIQTTLARTTEILQEILTWDETSLAVAEIGTRLSMKDPGRLPLFKQILLRYRRHRAASTECMTDKTFHLELTDTLEEEIKALDALTRTDWFGSIENLRLPRLKDFLPVQFIEAVGSGSMSLPPRQYDEKFHILQAPSLFLPDLHYFRAQCEDRDVPLAVAFLDIDHFKDFNTKHTETKVDRNLLPRFMQAIESHVFHHGYAYRQGGDEYLVLIPSISRDLAIAFLEELRCKLASLTYPQIEGKTTVSIGLCLVEPDCPLTDRELRDRASQAKVFAKEHGRNRIATFAHAGLRDGDLELVPPSSRQWPTESLP